MSLHCWWFGCKLPPSWTFGDQSCARCGGYVEYSDMVGDTRHGRTMDRLKSVWRFFWPKRCVDCGRRFRACDESVDHIPF